MGQAAKVERERQRSGRRREGMKITWMEVGVRRGKEREKKTAFIIFYSCIFCALKIVFFSTFHMWFACPVLSPSYQGSCFSPQEEGFSHL